MSRLFSIHAAPFWRDEKRMNRLRMSEVDTSKTNIRNNSEKSNAMEKLKKIFTYLYLEIK